MKRAAIFVEELWWKFADYEDETDEELIPIDVRSGFYIQKSEKEISFVGQEGWGIVVRVVKYIFVII